MVPNIEEDYILLLGIVFYIRSIILLGSITKKTLLTCDHSISTGIIPVT